MNAKRGERWARGIRWNEIFNVEGFSWSDVLHRWNQLFFLSNEIITLVLKEAEWVHSEWCCSVHFCLSQHTILIGREKKLPVRRG